MIEWLKGPLNIYQMRQNMMCLLKFLFDEEISPHSVRAPIATPSKLASMDGKYSKLRRYFLGGCRSKSLANKYGFCKKDMQDDARTGPNKTLM